jgi:hydroxymethylpyrimidine pyrophosphatase-like HAD family hydrolase
MGAGVMSLRTIHLIDRLRACGVQFVYVTGARWSTLEERLPLMAVVDAAFCETGGRLLVDECSRLDARWAATMETTCGPPEAHSLEALCRPGALWDWARLLVELGYLLDTRSYFYGFRVDLAKQRDAEHTDEARFVALIRSAMPEVLQSASNLGKRDFFPAVSGKGNAARYFLERAGLGRQDAVALFDDDNDLPLAAAAGRCWCVQATHPAVAAALRANPDWRRADAPGVLAAEQALSALLADLQP